MRQTSSVQILWSDENYVAIAKPAGLAVIPGRGETNCALEEVAAMVGLPCKGPDDPRLRVVHRIDKDTSGVVLFAKNRAAQQHVSHQFQNNRVSKEYLALVAGEPLEDRGEIDAALAVHPTQPKKMTISKQGRPAKTLWQIEQRYRGLTLLRVFPKTGKTHQIRVHLRSIGTPLAIDPLYNPKSPGEEAGIMLSQFKRGYRGKDEEERPLISRLTLHAEKLRFVNIDGRDVEIVAAAPKDLRATLNSLGKYARK